MNREQLMARIDQSWENLLSSYAGLRAAQMTADGVVGNWSIRDIIAHVTTWEVEALRHLPTILDGGRPPRYAVLYGGIDAFNARMAEQKSKLPLRQVLQQRDSTHNRLIRFIGRVPEAQFIRETRFRKRLRLDTYGHYAKHAEAIRKWREAAGGFYGLVQL